MFNNISWQGYWIAIALIVTFYYAFVILWFYRGIILQRVQNRTNRGTYHPPVSSVIGTQPPLFPGFGSSSPEDTEAPESIPGVSSLVDEVQAYFENSDLASTSKAKLLNDLGFLAQKYPMVKGSAYQNSVNNLILFLAEQNGSIHLSADDVSAVWFR